ncbi:Suppressor of Sensor Kinase (SLN1) [Marasmius sp. AFHP31]|nr:Suppressor of Sensor Kinase (SLN1) [Marasmius sp. AFHP31]
MLSLHTPKLYSHSEQDSVYDESSEWHHHRTLSSRPTLSISAHPTPSSSSSVPIYPDVYSQFIKRYRSDPGGLEDSRNDPDTHYFHRGLGQLADAGAESDDEELLAGLDGLDISQILESESIQAPASEEEKDRLSWQMYFASVLRGDVLRSEKTRIADALESSADDPNNHVSFWLEIRAKIHGYTIQEEKRYLEERRARCVDRVIQEILHFRIEDGMDMTQALERVLDVLRRLDGALSLYPTLRSFYVDRPVAAENEFQARCDTLNTWSTVLNSIRYGVHTLQRWTGSQTLDVTQKNTSGEVFISTGPRPEFTGGADVTSDGTSFVERIMKEESMQRMFEKRTLVIAYAFVAAARDCQVNLAGLLEAMNLPTFEKELLPLISFPTNLAQACLHMRLTYVQKMQDPGLLIIDQTIDDLKLNIGLACALKRQYEAFLVPDPDGRWNLPVWMSDDYDSTILNSVLAFFRLVHRKLKGGAKGGYLKETEVLDAQMPTLNDVSLTVAGGSRLVAEQLCSITSKLMFRVVNYFDAQIRVPEEPGDSNNSKGMTDKQKAAWYGKILDSVKSRYRKLQRFARDLTQRFSNSAEYSLEGVQFDQFVECLVTTNHVLVYTSTYEEEGVYIIASGSLMDRPNDVKRILTEVFQVNPHDRELHPPGYYPGYGDSQYVLILSPRSHFYWPLQTGRVMVLDVPKLNLEMKDDRVRLVADGPEQQLEVAKQIFSDIFVALDEHGVPLELNGGALTCIRSQQAHLPSVDRELRKITRSTVRLAESIVDSVHHVRQTMAIASTECQDLMEDWYQFAAEHGKHAQQRFFTANASSSSPDREGSNRSSMVRFNRMLNKLAISWVSFICDDCPPNERKTFKWAVNALEFAFQRTKRDILHLPDEQFQMLRHKVGICVALLMGHFDILGARSSLEATREKERQKLQGELGLGMDASVFEDDDAEGEDAASALPDPRGKKFWERVTRALDEVDGKRAAIAQEYRAVGRVLDTEQSEADRTLVFLVSSTSSIAIRWQQGRLIGAGSFGSVYQAVNLDSGTLMAVKEINLFHELSTLPNLCAQIMDELRVMEVLHHPNIVEYYGIEVHRDKVFIFEEYCQGGTLAALLEHGRIEDEGITQVYTMQMLEGLAYLHSQGIVHRDIKPENILLDHLGVLKFADFGAAKILAKNQRSTRVKSRRGRESTRSSDPSAGGPLGMNSLNGTPMYMSPEIIKNDKQGKLGAMDIWSMGCVILEFATGRKPWSHLDNEWAIMFHIGVATQHPPLPEPGQLSGMGIDFIRQCLSIDANKRPTAVELMEHPWMINFRAVLASYEEEEETEVEHLPPQEKFENASVAYQAALIQEKEVEEIAKPSPSVSTVMTPEEEEDNLTTSPPLDI